MIRLSRLARLPLLRPRLLPVTIFAAVLMLGLRLGDLWFAFTSGHEISVAPSHAEPASAGKGNGKANGGKGAPVQVASTAPDQAQAPAQNGHAGSPGQTAQAPAPAQQPPPQAAPQTPAMGPVPPSMTGSEKFTPADMELLQRLSERRGELDRRARELDQREAFLVAAEQRFDQKVAELQKLRQEIQNILKVADEQQQQQLESLVRIYETMKPKEAARIFEALDMPVLLGVIGRMKETKTAPILAAMDPVKAKEVTIALADRRQLPQMPQQ